MAVAPERVDELAERSWSDAVALVLGADDPDPAVPEVSDSGDGWETTAAWWLRRMADPDGGLGEYMTWFWHELLPVETWKVDLAPLLADYLRTLRVHALGTYPELLRAVVTGGAMIRYLDADGSVASNPNENLARELMELFTVGRGHYTEDDVKAGARALAGWHVEYETAEVVFDEVDAFVAPLIFRGVQARWDLDAVLDHLLADPSTAVRISSRLHRHLTGVDPVDPAELGRWWAGTGLSIRPLLERILTTVDLGDPALGRARSGVEWWAVTAGALGIDADDLWQVDQTRQRPFGPPNVAGWPTGAHWIGPGPLLGRASVVQNLDLDRADLDGLTAGDVSVAIDAIGRRLCVPAWSDATRAAMTTAATNPGFGDDHGARTRLLIRLALLSPEVALP